MYKNKNCLEYGGNSFFLVNGSTTDVIENKWCNKITENVKLMQLNKRKNNKVACKVMGGYEYFSI